MMIRINKFLRDNRGANLVEYIILVGVIALIAIAGFKIFGEKVMPHLTTCSLPHEYGRVPSETPMTPLGVGERK